MASRSETSITLSLARLARTSGEDKVRKILSAASARSDCSLLAERLTRLWLVKTRRGCSAQPGMPKPPVCLEKVDPRLASWLGVLGM